MNYKVNKVVTKKALKDKQNDIDAIVRLQSENAALKAQLAESDKEVKRLNIVLKSTSETLGDELDKVRIHLAEMKKEILEDVEFINKLNGWINQLEEEIKIHESEAEEMKGIIMDVLKTYESDEFSNPERWVKHHTEAIKQMKGLAIRNGWITTKEMR